MKKILSILFVAIVAVTASSCKKETVVAPTAQPILTTASNWTTSDGGVTYFTDIQVPEIDEYYYDNGAVLVYNYLSDGDEYEQLPSVYGGISYTYTYATGHVYITAQNSNGTSVTVRPPTLKIKVVLLD